MLINKDRVAVGVDHRKPARALRPRFHSLRQLDAACRLDRCLQIANIREVLEGVARRIPAGVKSQRILLEHPLKEA